MEEKRIVEEFPAESMRSLQTEVYEDNADEVVQIYSFNTSEKVWSTDEILGGGDVRPFFDAIASLSTVSSARIMLVYLMKKNLIPINTASSEKAIRFAEESDIKTVEEHLSEERRREAKSGCESDDILFRVSERTEKQADRAGFKRSGRFNWDKKFAELLKKPTAELLQIPAYTYRMSIEECEKFMKKAIRREHFNLYDREEILMWIVLRYSKETDDFFLNHKRLRKMYPVRNRKGQRAENTERVVRPAEITRDTNAVSTRYMLEYWYDLMEKISDDMGEADTIFAEKNGKLAEFLDWAEQRSTVSGLSEEHRILRSPEKVFLETMDEILDTYNKSLKYEKERRADKISTEKRKMDERYRRVLRVQYECTDEETEPVIPAGTELLSKTDEAARMVLPEKLVLKRSSEIEVRIKIRALTKKEELSKDACALIDKKFVREGKLTPFAHPALQGEIYRVVPGKKVRYFTQGQDYEEGILTAWCSPDVFIPKGMKFALDIGKDRLLYETLEPGNMIEKRIPVRLQWVEAVERTADGKENSVSKEPAESPVRTGRKKKTRLPLLPGTGGESRAAGETYYNKETEGVIEANSGKKGLLPLRETGKKGYMNAYCKCNAFVPEGSFFHLICDDMKYVFRTLEDVRTGVVRETDFTVKWLNADELFESVGKKTSVYTGTKAVTIIPDGTEFSIIGEVPQAVKRIYTPKPMTYGKSVREEEDIKISANYNDVFERFCGTEMKDEEFRGVSCYGPEFLLNTREFLKSRIRKGNRYGITGKAYYRNKLLTLAFMSYCIKEDVSEKGNQTDRKRNEYTSSAWRFRDYANKLLKRCGMHEIYEGNAIDVFYFMMASSDLPGEVYPLIWNARHPLTAYIAFNNQEKVRRHWRILRYNRTGTQDSPVIWAEWDSDETFASVPRLIYPEEYRYVLEISLPDTDRKRYDIPFHDPDELQEFQFTEF